MAARFSVPVQGKPNFAGITPAKVFRWSPSLALWGIAVGGAVTLFASPIPLFQKDVLLKLPITSSYFADKTPDSDKPF